MLPAATLADTRRYRWQRPAFHRLNWFRKTHLAVGLLCEPLLTRGATGPFYDYRDLLKQVQNSYNPNVAETEPESLEPVFSAEV